MRKSSALVVLVAIALFVAVPAAGAKEVPGNSSAFGAANVVWQQRIIGWLFGSATNPLLQPGFCGEVINHVFYFNAAAVPVFDANCVVPSGTPMAATPGGTIEWEPTNGITDQALLAQLALDAAAITNPAVTLDGHVLNLAGTFATTGVYTIPVAPTSLIKTVDPTFPPELTQARVASAAWTVLIAPLPPGQHELVLSDEILGDPFTATFHITVEAGHA